MVINVSRRHFLYAIIVLETACCLWWFGLFSGGPNVTMTREEHSLCVSALKLTAEDIGHFETGKEAVDAFVRNCPTRSALRESLRSSIGNPGLDDFVSRTENVLRKARVE